MRICVIFKGQAELLSGILIPVLKVVPVFSGHLYPRMDKQTSDVACKNVIHYFYGR